MVFCSIPTFFCYSSNSPKYRLFRQNPSPLNFCLERYSFNAFALSENMHYWLKGIWNLANNV